MHPAVRIQDIEEHVRKNLYPYPQSSILLIFSSYSGAEDGDNYEFLRSLHSYHYHSGPNTACYCIGYSVTDPTPGFGPGKKVSEEFGVKFFYPKLFEECRAFVQASLNQKWQYRGGIDLLLFGADQASAKPVAWDRAAVAQSKALVPRIFADAEEMIRTVLNLNEAAHGKMVPDELNPVIAQKKFLYHLKEAGRLLAGPVAGGLLKLVIASG
jgi:hypothetical protein